MTLPSSLVDSVRNGRCILFTGAGVNYPPPDGSPYFASYPPEMRPPLGAELSKDIVEDGGLVERFPGIEAHTGNLARMAALYEIAHGRKNLVNLVAKRIKGDPGSLKRPSPVVRALAELPFQLVITTNYDQLYERALGLIWKNEIADIYSPIDTARTNPSLDDPHPDSPRLFKMHGDVDRADSLVITEDDYIRFILRMRDQEPYKVVPKIFEYRLSSWPILFIGYSLADINFRLILMAMRWKIDVAHIAESYAVVGPSVDPIVEVSLRGQQVVFVAESAWNVVPRLYEQILEREIPT